MLCSIIATYVHRRLFILPSWRFRFPYTRKISLFRHELGTTTTLLLLTPYISTAEVQFILLVKSYNWWLMKSRAGHVSRGHKFDPRDFPEDITWMFDSLIIRRQPQKIDDNFQGGGSIFDNVRLLLLMVEIDSCIIVFDQWLPFYSLVLTMATVHRKSQKFGKLSKLNYFKQ